MAQHVASRWDVEIRGPAVSETGDLRLAGDSSRIVLQFADSSFQVLHNLQIGHGTIAFDLDGRHRHFVGTVTDTLMQGEVIDADGSRLTWSALPLVASSARWPVPPRVTVRQLATGTDSTVEQFAGAWMAALPPMSRIVRIHDSLAQVANVAAFDSANLARGTTDSRIGFGIDPAIRQASRAWFTALLDRPGVDPRLEQLLRPHGLLRLDIHDVAIEEARHYLVNFDLAAAVRGLVEIDPGLDVTDSAVTRRVAWRWWERLEHDSIAVLGALESLARRDRSGSAALKAWLQGYHDATQWWREAVLALMESRWMASPGGVESPAQAVARFWGVDSLPLPRLVAVPLDGANAMPQLDVRHIARWLLEPANAVASEWLERGARGGRGGGEGGGRLRAALAAWLAMSWDTTTIEVVHGAHVVRMVSPAQEARARPAAFFGPSDAIRIDPGIAPIEAVAVFIHEWHHLIAQERRLAGPKPTALVDETVQLRLLPDDPWMSEGFAEWATTQTLQHGGQAAALPLLGQVEKRLATARHLPDDPHVLGFRLILAASSHIDSSRFRDLVVATLHDPTGLARRAGLASSRTGRSKRVFRPANAAVIPEISFTFDGGAALRVSRRLRIPDNQVRGGH